MAFRLSSGSSSSSKSAKPAVALPKNDANAPNDIKKLDIKVGRILSSALHPTAASNEKAANWYVSEVDVAGAEGPIKVVSEFAKVIPLEQMQGRLVALVMNLKPTSVIGVKTLATILTAKSADGAQIELLTPPASAKAGERVTFAGFPLADPSAPELARANENALKVIIPELKTTAEGVAAYKGIPFMTTAGPVTVATLKNVQIAKELEGKSKD